MVELAPTLTVEVNFDCPTSGTARWLCWGNGTSEFPAQDGRALFERAFVCPNASSTPTVSQSALPTAVFTAQSSQSGFVTGTVPPSSGQGGVQPWVIGVVSTVVIIGVAVGAVLLWVCLRKPSAGQDQTDKYSPRFDRAHQDLIGDNAP
jgi:hypothetical protein